MTVNIYISKSYYINLLVFRLKICLSQLLNINFIDEIIILVHFTTLCLS